jgi:hypothetical protein
LPITFSGEGKPISEEGFEGDPSPPSAGSIYLAPAWQGRSRYPEHTRLVGAAALSVLAHLEELVARGAVVTEGSPSIAGTYRLA